MLGTDMLMAKTLRFLGRIVQDALAFLAQGHFHGGGDALANGNARFDLLADRFDGAMSAQKTIGEGLVFTHQAEQKMLGFDVRTPVLTGLIAREKDYAAGLFRIAFKHGSALFSL